MLLKKENRLRCLLSILVFVALLFFIETQPELIIKTFGYENAIKYIDFVYYGVLFLFYIIVFRKTLWDCLKDFKNNYKKYVSIIIICAFITFVLIIVAAIILDICGIGESDNQKAVDAAVANYGIFMTLPACLFGPLVEEVVHRGIVLGAIKGEESGKVRTVISIIIGAILFGMIHCNYMELSVIEILTVIPQMLMGLMFGIVYVLSNNIFCPIVVHMIINVIATI